MTRFEREAQEPREPAAREHHPRLRLPSRARRAVHRDGVRAGHRPLRPPREVRAPAVRRRGDHRDAGRARARLRALPQHRPSRHQARERHAVAPGRREGDGLRHRARHAASATSPRPAPASARPRTCLPSRCSATSSTRAATSSRSASCSTRWSPARSRSSRTRSARRCTRSGSRSTSRVRKLNPEIPRELERIIDKCLEKQPRDRWRSAQHMVMALERFLARHVEMNHHARLVLFLRAQNVITELEAEEYLNPAALGGDAACSRSRTCRRGTRCARGWSRTASRSAMLALMLGLIHVAPLGATPDTKVVRPPDRRPRLRPRPRVPVGEDLDRRRAGRRDAAREADRARGRARTRSGSSTTGIEPVEQARSRSTAAARTTPPVIVVDFVKDKVGKLAGKELPTDAAGERAVIRLLLVVARRRRRPACRGGAGSDQRHADLQGQAERLARADRRRVLRRSQQGDLHHGREQDRPRAAAQGGRAAADPGQPRVTTSPGDTFETLAATLPRRSATRPRSSPSSTACRPTTASRAAPRSRSRSRSPTPRPRPSRSPASPRRTSATRSRRR